MVAPFSLVYATHCSWMLHGCKMSLSLEDGYESSVIHMSPLQKIVVLVRWWPILTFRKNGPSTFWQSVLDWGQSWKVDLRYSSRLFFLWDLYLDKRDCNQEWECSQQASCRECNQQILRSLLSTPPHPIRLVCGPHLIIVSCCSYYVLSCSPRGNFTTQLSCQCIHACN